MAVDAGPAYGSGGGAMTGPETAMGVVAGMPIGCPGAPHGPDCCGACGNPPGGIGTACAMAVRGVVMAAETGALGMPGTGNTGAEATVSVESGTPARSSSCSFS